MKTMFAPSSPRAARILAALLACLLAAPAAAQIYRWVDDEGRVHYGDKIPAKYAKNERSKLNQQGQTVDVRSREKTADERAAEERARIAREQQRQQEAEQARYDSFLLSTYPTVGALERARDDRLAIMDGQIVNARKSQQEALNALEVLQQRAARIGSNGRPVPEKLQSQIAAFEDTHAEARRRIVSVERERENVAADFARDRARLAELLDSRSAYRE